MLLHEVRIDSASRIAAKTGHEPKPIMCRRHRVPDRIVFQLHGADLKLSAGIKVQNDDGGGVEVLATC